MVLPPSTSGDDMSSNELSHPEGEGLPLLPSTRLVSISKLASSPINEVSFLPMSPTPPKLAQRSRRNSASSAGSSSSQSTINSTNVLLHDRELFDALEDSECSADGSNSLTVRRLLKELELIGFHSNDPRLSKVYARFQQCTSDVLDFPTFRRCIQPAAQLIERALNQRLCIPNFKLFTRSLDDIRHTVVSEMNRASSLAGSEPQPQLVSSRNIPALSHLPPASRDVFGLGFCSIDGQQFSAVSKPANGHSTLNSTTSCITLQGIVKPFLYLMALQDAGEAVVHNFVGREPSGRHFNSLNLSHEDIPENPLLDSGAMMCTSLIKPRLPASDRYQHVYNILVACSSAAGDSEADGNSSDGGQGGAAGDDSGVRQSPGISFSNTVYLSMLGRTDRSYCMGHMMQERGAFQYGRGSRDQRNPFRREWDSSRGISSNLELFLQACCIEMSLTNLAVLGATLAFGGVNPFTGKRIFAAENVKNCLSLMLSCGMNIYSGQWAYEIGLPAKFGLSGQLLIVVPNVGGLALYSPRLHPDYTISAGGLLYAKLFNQVTPFHHLKIAQHDDIVASQPPNNTSLFQSPFASEPSNRKQRASVRESDTDESDEERTKEEEKEREKGAVDNEHAQFHVESVLDRRVTLVHQIDAAVQICYYASAGDLHGLISLSAQGYDLSLTDYDGRTGLHLAARSGHLACTKFLLAHGVDVNPIDRMKGTPLTDALRAGHTDIARCLQAAGAVEGKDMEQTTSEAEKVEGHGGVW